MRKVALRGLLARKLRLALTALAVALGVTLIAGTYVFTDTINKSFDKIFVAVEQGHRRGRHAAPGPSRATTDAAAAPRRDPRPGQAAAGGRRGRGRRSSTQGGSFRKDGKSLRAGGLAELRRLRAVDPRFRAVRRRRRAACRSTADEVAIDAKRPPTARASSVGDKISLAGDGARKKPYKIVGITTDRRRRLLRRRRRSSTSTLPEAQRMTGNAGRYDEIEVAAQAGRRAPTQLSAQHRAGRARASVTVRTGEQQAAKQSQRHQATPSASCAPRCSPSRASRCSSARSSSSTPSRSRSPSAPASSRCCARSAPSARQVLRSVLAEGLVLGVAGLGRRPRRSASLVAVGPAGAVQGRRRRPAVERHASSRRARSSSRCSSARS